MKRILAIVNDEITKDPRALKFRKALQSRYDVITVCSSYTKHCDEGTDIIIKKQKCLGFIGLIIYWLKVLFKVKRLKPDIILAHNYYMAFPGLLASIFCKKPLVYDAYEFYAPQRGVRMSKRDYFFFYLEKVTIKRSNLVFSANEERSRLMKSAYKLDRKPIPILNIPNYNITSIRDRKICSEEITVVYEGFITYTRYVDLLVEAFEFLPPCYKLVFIGGGHDEERLKNLIDSKSYNSRIEFRGRIDSKDVIPSLAKCDVGFVGYPFKDLNNRFCSPNKIYEYPASGLPFVTTNQSPIWRITNTYHICEYYDPRIDGAVGIAKAIQKVVDKYSWYCENIPLFLDNNSWSNEEQRLLDAFDVVF